MVFEHLEEVSRQQETQEGVQRNQQEHQ